MESIYTTFVETTAPNTSTAGIVGQLYLDTSSKTLYQCVEADTSTPKYTWGKINHSSGDSVLLWSGGESGLYNNDNSTAKEIDFDYSPGDILEIEYELSGGSYVVADIRQYFKFKVVSTAGNLLYLYGVLGTDVFSVKIDIGFGAFKFYGPTKLTDNASAVGLITIYNIRKIIE